MLDGIEKISWAIAETPLFYKEAAALPSRDEPLRQVDAHYGSAPERYLIADGAESSLELAARALAPLLPAGDVRTFVHVQTYPDVEPLAAPMQRLLERFGLRPAFPVGVTHLTDVFAGLEIASLLPRPAIFLAVEVYPYAHQRPAGWRDYAVAMRLSEGTPA